MTRKDSLESRKDRFLEQAIRCLAANPRASLNEVAEFAGVGIATLHRYFESREKLYVAISYRALDLVEKAVAPLDLSQGSLREMVQNLAEALVPLGDRTYFLLSEYYNIEDPDLDSRENRLWQGLKEEFRKRQRSGELSQALEIDWIFTVLYTLVFALWSEIHAGNVAPNKAAGILTDTMLLGVGRRDP